MLLAFNIKASAMRRNLPSRAKQKRNYEFFKDHSDELMLREDAFLSCSKLVISQQQEKEYEDSSSCSVIASSALYIDEENERIRTKMERRGKRRRRGRRRRRRKEEGEEEESIDLSVVKIRSSKLWLWTSLYCFLSLYALGVTETSGQTSKSELAEGLSLNQNSNNGNQYNRDWPVQLEQLERIKQESRVGAQVGQNVVLNCAVQFKDGMEKPFVVNWLKYPHKLPIYIWYAGYPAHVAAGYENRVARIGQASLNLSRVRESDQGLYECRIYYLDRRADDKGNGTWIFLDVQAPPHFTQSPAPISYVPAGNSLQLTCQAESTPAPVLRWYKNKLPIDSDSGPYRLVSSGAISSGPASGSQQTDEQQQQLDYSTDQAHQELLGARQSSRLELHIDQVLAGTTTGDYRCLASNSEGSVETRAQVALAVPAIITQVPKNQSKLEGERVELVCQAKALPPNITHKWLFNEKPIQSLKWFENRHSIRRDGTLVISSLHRDDRGRYTCQASNGIPHHQTASTSTSQHKLNSASSSVSNSYAEASAFLNVEYPARVSQSPSPQYLPLGLSGLIRCYVQAEPPVEFFTWTQNNQQFEPNLDPNIERLSNGSLLVRKVTKNYEGLYRCTPFNVHGSAGSSAAMEIKVEEPPVFELRPAELYKAPAGGHISMPCEARGFPRPTVTWRRVLSSSSTSAVNSATVSSSSSTSIGDTLPSTSTTLSLADQVAGDEPDAEMHEPHDPPELVVTEAAEPAISMNLQRQQEEQQQSVIPIYAPLPSDRSDLKNSHLLIHGLRKEDHGRYECLIENEVATLIASTMLYIEETTPHAPTDVQVTTKTWSAQVSWRSGYDGGFEQSFVVSYRQVAIKANQKDQSNTKNKQVEQVDLNWRSAPVLASDATTFTVQNLSQDTSYEFFVRARNIIGEGPRSKLVTATTKRAISGSITPVIPTQDESSSSSNSQDELVDPTPRANVDDDEQQEISSQSSTLNPSVLGIIHLVDYTSSSTPHPSAGVSVSDLNHSAGQLGASSSIQRKLNSGSADLSEAEQQSNSSKVIRIYFPTKTSGNSSSSSSASGDSTASQLISKRPRYDQPDSAPLDSSADIQLQPDEIPQNLSLAKVAQGWVLSWSPPKRFPDGDSQPVMEVAASRLSGSQSTSTPTSAPPASYTLEFREKGGSWQNLPITGQRERSLLLKDLRPGSEYVFRLFAQSPASGTRSPPSPELRYTIPDNRRKPGSTQALSAGVVSGFLFFVACIVIAVCAVNMCNKRRKKRAEKAAYVMMACPVLESHHDIAALNSNSLMKNSSSSTAQGGISSVMRLAYLLGGSSLRKSCDKSVTSQKTLSHTDNATKQPGIGGGLSSHRIKFSANEPLPVDVTPCYLETGNPPTLACEMPVDLQAQQQTARDKPDGLGSAQIEAAKGDEKKPSGRPLDDYWMLGPTDRKWGTLTVAYGSRLAREQRAREVSSKTEDEQQFASMSLPRPSQANGCLKDAAKHHDEGDQSNSVDSSSCRQEQQFSSWLREQLVIGGNGKVNCPSTGNKLSERPQACLAALATTRADQQAARGGSGDLGEGEGSSWALQCQQLHHYQLYTGAAAVAAGKLHQQSRRSLSGGLIEPLRLTAFQPAHQQQQLNDTTGLEGGLYNPEQQMLAPPEHEPSEGARNAYASTIQCRKASQTVRQLSYLGPGRRSLPASHKSPPTCQVAAPEACSWPTAGPNGLNYTSAPTNYASYLARQQTDDSLLTENACLGSYKRKRHLPHIEAQFTISSPPSGGQNSMRSQPSNYSEHEVIASGNLFVRPPKPPPPGLPTPGQRTEQRRLKQHSLISGVPQVSSMNAQEKIESYLRHYNSLNQSSSPQENTIRAYTPIALDEPEELTFQPYENLPNLRYTILLPIQRGPNGSLILNETHHLRRSGRRQDYSTLSKPSTVQRCRRSKHRLGSSSSCPAPDLEVSARMSDVPEVSERCSRLNGRSLESALELASVRAIAAEQLINHNSSLTMDPDSLENIANQRNLTRPLVYRSNHTPSPADIQHLRSSLLRELSSPPPPPPPPHAPSVTPPSTAKSNSSLIQSGKSDQTPVPPPPPPPIPPHRSPQENRDQTNKGAITKKKEKQTSSSSSPGAASSASSSSSTGNGTSEALTNEQSVDENYEFDLISSCSSSVANKNKQLANHNPKQNQREQQIVNGDLYAQVNKQQIKRPDNNDSSYSLGDDHKQKFERVRFYHSSSCKEQQLSVKESPTFDVQQLPVIQHRQNNNVADYYDTVYDDHHSKLEESSTSQVEKKKRKKKTKTFL